jgi:hypothetical protein
MTDTPYLSPADWPSFHDAYMYLAGTSEIPIKYHEWCCISILGASLARRVKTTKGHMSIYPNLYTYLLGPSANGKSAAIAFAHRLINAPTFRTLINPVQGSASAMGTFDFMGTRIREGTYNPDRRHTEAPEINVDALEESLPLYWICPELANSMGTARQAKSLIYMLTDLYEGHETAVQDMKRGSGHVIIKAPIINWLAGTTEEWFLDIVPPGVLEGGFIGRMIMVHEGYTEERYVEPVLPENEKEMREYIQRFIYQFVRLEGVLSLTEEALSIDKEWYMTRQPPSDPSLRPGWRRQHDLARKLAMLVAIGDPNEWAFAREFPGMPPVITLPSGKQLILTHDDAWWVLPGEHSMLIRSEHMAKGHQLSYMALKFASRLAGRLDLSRQAKLVLRLTRLFTGKDKELAHSFIAKTIGGGITRKELQEAYTTLMDRGKIRIVHRPIAKGRRAVKMIEWISSPQLKKEWWQEGEEDEEGE